MSAKSLNNLLKDFANEAVTRFPHLKGRLLVMNMNADTQVCVNNNDINEEKTGLTPDAALTYLSEHWIVRDCVKAKSGASCSSWDANRGVAIVIFEGNLDESQASNLSREQERKIMFELDHELGHMAIENGYDVNKGLQSDILNEAIADAYATIRQYQRYGEAHTGDYDSVSRAMSLTFGIRDASIAHFSSFVQEEIIRRKDIIDFASLSPEQTAALSWRFAMEYTPQLPVIEHIRKIYRPVVDAYNDAENGPSGEKAFKVLADITLNPNNSYYTFKFGALLLNDCIRNQWFGGPLNLPKEYMDDVSTKLKEREFKLAQEDILFNMPRVTAKPRAFPANQMRLF